MFVEVRDRSRDVRFRLYAERRGRGPTVLYIGGSGRRLADRPNVFDTPLAVSGTIVAYDQRGIGSSDAPPGEWTMADYADDAAALAAALDLATCSVVGVSFGGMVAQELAVRHPTSIERLVLVATSPGGAGGSSYPIDELGDVDPRRRAEIELELADTRHDARWRAMHPVEVERWVERLAESSPPSEGELRQLRARRNHDCWDRLTQIEVPTLVCAGRFDGVAPLDRSEVMAGRLRRGRLAVFEGGHRFVAQDPSAWPTIVCFLATASGAAPASTG